MKITKENEEIVVKIPFWSKRTNPYMVDEKGEFLDVGEFQTLTGLICDPPKNCIGCDPEMGFALTIDMDYKDKGDQVDGYVIMWSGSEKDFIAKCEELGLEIYDLRKNKNL